MVATAVLNKLAGSRRSLTLKAIESLTPTVGAGDLRQAVDRAVVQLE